MNGFEKRANQIKEKIMSATLELLRTSDLKRIRIADISKRAQVSQVTIYNYFGSKEALIRQVFIHYVEKAILDFEQYMNEGHSLKDKIEYIIFQEKETYRELPLGVVKELLLGDQELTRYIEKQYKEITIPMTIRIIEEGKASGEIAEDVSIESVLAFIQIYMNQYEALLNMAHKSRDMDKFLEGVVNMFFYGVCGKR